MQNNGYETPVIDQPYKKTADNSFKDKTVDHTLGHEFNKTTADIKIKLIQDHLMQIMQILGMDTTKENIAGTPGRLAHLYVKELFSGLDPAHQPSLLLIEKHAHYNEMIMIKNISFFSCSEHDLMPFTGKMHIAYISKNKMINSQDLCRLVQYHSRKPQIQEGLIEEIAVALKECLLIQDVALIAEAVCFHPAAQEFNKSNSKVTAHYSGRFQNEDTKREFYQYLKEM